MKPIQRAQARVELEQRAQASVKSESGHEGARKTSGREGARKASARETSGREGARETSARITQFSERRRA